MGEVFYSCKSHRKIAHYPHCHFIRRISKANRSAFNSVEEALEQGYRLCNCCPPSAIRYRRERAAIKNFCAEAGLQSSLQNGSIHVISLCDFWRITTLGKSHKLKLFHKNTIFSYGANEIPSPFAGYHIQKFNSPTIMGYLLYIQEHDKYSVRCSRQKQASPPTRDNAYVPIWAVEKYGDNLTPSASDARKSKKKHKKKPQSMIGTKKYKKEQRLLKKEKKWAETERVLRLIDEISGKK